MALAAINAVAGNVMDAVGVQRQWHDGLCDCCSDMGLCCDVYWCTPCSAARMCNAIDGSRDNFDGALCFAIFLLTEYANQLGTVSMILRYRIIAKYNIGDEGVIMTFFKAQCCPLCSMCQTHRMLTHSLKIWPGGTCCHTQEPGAVGLVNTIMK